jgi:hypothetical protein
LDAGSLRHPHSSRRLAARSIHSRTRPPRSSSSPPRAAMKSTRRRGMQVSRISRRALSKLLDSVRAGSEADSQPDRAARPARREPGSYGLCAAKIRSRPGIRHVGARC